MSIFKIFLKLNGLNCEEVNEIETCFIPFYIKKGKYLLKYNNICDHIAFIEKGAVQHCILREGDFITKNISWSNNFVTSFKSFLTQEKATENIIALTNCKILIIEKQKLIRLCHRYPAFNSVYLNYLQQTICEYEDHLSNRVLLTRKQHFEKLIKQNPLLLQKVSLKVIASLIGVTARHLGRIRNEQGNNLSNITTR